MDLLFPWGGRRTCKQDGGLILLVNKCIRGDGYFADRLQETGQGMGGLGSLLYFVLFLLTL